MICLFKSTRLIMVIIKTSALVHSSSGITNYSSSPRAVHLPESFILVEGGSHHGSAGDLDLVAVQKTGVIDLILILCCSASWLLPITEMVVC